LKKSTTFGLSFLTGILAWAAWPVLPLTFFIFIAFIPLLYLADKVEGRRTFFLLGFLAMLTWNACTTWWIWNSSDAGSIAAIIANSLLMYLPWWGYRVCKRKMGKNVGYVSLVVFILTFEYIHLNWQLSWPWLTIGNVFASRPAWVQWYEYTGVSGGTTWVLVTNILLYNLFIAIRNNKFSVKKAVPAVVVLVVPFLVSVTVTPTEPPNTQTSNVVMVQPNIDPYGKFSTDPADEIKILLGLTQSAIDANTRLVIWPETALTADCDESQVAYNKVYQPVFAFVQAHPNITLQTGIETYKNYGPVKATSTARLTPDKTIYYDAFNAAVAFKVNTPLVFYHKSRLVPGVETLPSFLNFMAPIFEQFGGTTGGYGHQKESAVFQQPGQPYVTAPVICYENEYGEYVSTYVQKGANLLTVMTNDGWWGNTSGHKQHLDYTRLRAIETRRWVARSANTGISAVINDRGEILETQPWDKAAFIKYNIPVMEKQTFYVQHGDVLFQLGAMLSVILFVWLGIIFIKQKRAR